MPDIDNSQSDDVAFTSPTAIIPVMSLTHISHNASPKKMSLRKEFF